MVISLKGSRSEVRGVIRILHTKGSSRTKLQDEVVSHNDMDVKII